MTLSEVDVAHLRRCIDLAHEAQEAGDEPFGSVLVDRSGKVLFEDRNRVRGGDDTRHPELEIARWAAANVAPEDRAACTVYTSGEHCPMCSAAHAWVGLGRIVYAASSAQLVGWLSEWGIPAGPVAALSINQVAPDLITAGPVTEFEAELKELHRRARHAG